MRIFGFLMFMFFLSCEAPSETSEALPLIGIVNGTPTDYQSWQDAVMVETVYVRCTGTLIHPKVVLTAAHCIFEAPDASGGMGYDVSDTPSDVRINIGAEGEEAAAGIERIVMHPGWEGAISMEAPDLAMLLLTDAVGAVTPRRVADFPMPNAGDDAVIVGYGADPDDSNASGPLHRMGETSLLDVTPYYFEIGGQTNTCSGDSGGPLYVQQNDDWTLIGVTSFGPAECPAENRGYSVNLLSYCDWLNDTMRDFVGEDLGLSYCKSCEAAPVSSWGNPCGPGYSCCPEGTECRFPDGFSKNGLGFCAPSCCALGEAAGDICSDIVQGDESCAFQDEMGDAYCAIHCDADGDCPDGTACRNKPFESEKICIAEEIGTETSCSDTNPSDTEPVDTASTDNVDSETDETSDSDESTDSETGRTGAISDCSCHAVGENAAPSPVGAVFRWMKFV